MTGLFVRCWNCEMLTPVMVTDREVGDGDMLNVIEHDAVHAMADHDCEHCGKLLAGSTVVAEPV